MTTNVTNVEGLRFSIYDEATPNLDKLSSKLGAVQHAAERSVSRVKEWGKGMAIGALGAVGLGYGLQSVYEKAKDANLELEDATKKIAGVGFAFTHWQKGTSAVEKWNTSMEMAEDTTSKLAETEGRLKIGRMELAEIYASATQVGQRHNLNQEQMIALTEKLGATEKVLGTNAQYAALMITRASMTGTIMGRDKFGMMLKGAIGDMKAFHKMSEPKRFEAILKAMGDLVPAAEAMGTGMRGALFDIRKSVEQILRDFTKPLFGEQTKSLREFAKHVTEIQKDGKSIATVWGREAGQGIPHAPERGQVHRGPLEGDRHHLGLVEDGGDHGIPVSRWDRWASRRGSGGWGRRRRRYGIPRDRIEGQHGDRRVGRVQARPGCGCEGA